MMTSRLNRRLVHLEQRAAVRRLPPLEHTIVFVASNRKPVKAIRWSGEEMRWIDVPVPTANES